MKIGIVGYQGSGKSVLFHWLTDQAPDPAQSHTTQNAMTPVPEPRIDQLCEVYHPKKVTRASLELVDTPGLSRDHEGSAAKLGMIREAGCLVIVTAAYAGVDPWADLKSFEDDLLLADLDIVSRRVERLRESVKKPRPGRDAELEELAALEPVVQALDEGKPIHDLELSEIQERAIKSFQLLTRKPRLIVINTADDDEDPQRFVKNAPEGVSCFAAPLTMEVELRQMDDEERQAFCEEMGVSPSDRDQLIRQIMDRSRQMLFFTAGEKEVRTWMLPKGGTALDAADSIHTDLARGFIRAEVMQCNDLVELGSEREVKAKGLARQEHKDYVVKDGDILLIRHN